MQKNNALEHLKKRFSNKMNLWQKISSFLHYTFEFPTLYMHTIDWVTKFNKSKNSQRFEKVTGHVSGRYEFREVSLII